MSVREAVYVTFELPSLTETFVSREAESIATLGVKVRLFPLHIRRSTPPGARLSLLTSSSHVAVLLGHNLLVFATRPLRYLRELGAAMAVLRPALVGRQLFALLKAGELARHLDGVASEADVIHAHFAQRCADVAMVANRLARRSRAVTVTLHAVDVFRPESRGLLQRRLTGATRLVVAGNYIVSFLRENGYRVGACTVIRCGVDDSLLSSQPQGRTPEGTVLLTVGRLIEKKGWRTVVDAAEHLRSQGRQFKWLCIGGGPLLSTLRDTIEARGLQEVVTLAGPQPNHEVMQRISSATVFVLPCKLADDGDMDGLPVVLLEAMLAGVPVISTPVAGIPELISDGRNGILVPPDDSLSLAAAVGRLLDSEALRSSYGAAGRRTVQLHFNREQESLKLLETFNEAKQMVPHSGRLDATHARG